MAESPNSHKTNSEEDGPSVKAEVELLMNQLKAQRLIKIFVGDCKEPYLMSEATLVSASEYFSKSLSHEQSMGTEPGVLRFPDDGDFSSAWTVLLFWIVNKRLPDLYTHEKVTWPESGALGVWICTWVLADKYLLPELQDAVMLEMLRHFSSNYIADKNDVVELNMWLAVSPVDSPLRRLLAEETICAIYRDDVCCEDEQQLSVADLTRSDGVTGLSASLVTACHEYMKNGKTFPQNRVDDRKVRSRAWKEFFLGKPPLRRFALEYLPQLYED